MEEQIVTQQDTVAGAAEGLGDVGGGMVTGDGETVSFPDEGPRPDIVAFSRRWRGRVIMDATGIGDPVYDDLSQVLRDIEPFKLTAVNKPLLIQRLMGAVEQRQVSWPAAGNQQGDWDVLTAEMKRFEYEFAPLGGIRYGAPAGYHDDCVLALALAVYRKWEMGRVGNMLRLESGRGLFAHPPGIFRRRSQCSEGW